MVLTAVLIKIINKINVGTVQSRLTHFKTSTHICANLQ